MTHQTCPICAWINPETGTDGDLLDRNENGFLTHPTWRLLKHLMNVHFDAKADRQPWEDKVFTTVRIEER